MLNFNELPADIKDFIFKKNRPATSKEINENKEKYNIVLDHLEGMFEKTNLWFYDETEEDNIIDNDWGFANAMIDCICTENIDKKAEAEREDAIDRYYNNYD